MLKSDVKETIRMCELLNYNANSRICLRTFAGKGLKSTAKSLTVKFDSLPKTQSENSGFYLAINGGHKDSEITECRAIFAEWDNLPLDLQEVMWQEKGFLQPTFQVKTRKSIHCYWVLTQSIFVEKWRELQTDLLNFLDADRTLKNPSRVMRLAGYYHVQKDCSPLMCGLINVTGENFTYETLRNAIPMKNQKWDDYLKSFTLPCDEILSLADLLPKKHQDNLNLGVAQGMRDNIGIALTRELIAIEKYLISVGQKYQDSVESLLIDYVTRVGLENKDATRWLKSAQKYNDTPTLTEEMIKSKYASKTYQSNKPTKLKNNILDFKSNENIETEIEKDYSPKFNYTQLAFDALYHGKGYIAIDEDLYKFEKTHYVLCNKNLELKRIAKWCASHSFKLTEKAKITNVLEWALINLSVNPEKVNPSGINLKNGVLTIDFDELGKGKAILKPHDPKIIYTYCSEINYCPDVDMSDCLKLLECLDPPERKIFIQSIALSFDMNYFRKKLGRMRALMLEGKGNNGKDTLGATVATIFGHAMINCSFGDFTAYDQGRKFPLAKLNNALISWSSENTSLSNLDKVQSLKAAITGDGLSCEQKNKDEFIFTPKCLFIFNCNEPPQIKSGLEAIKSRWAILRFTKTYKMNPKKKMGELQADPRFKDDPNFIKERIAPAFLNLLIKELENLAQTGIDYEPVQESFEQLKRESSHLYQFCEDVGIIEDPSGKIYVNELWELLRGWYIDQGVLEIQELEKGKEKLIWHDQANKFDKNVKASNQITARFMELFPNAKRVKETIDQSKVGQSYLSNLGFIASFDSLSINERLTASFTGSLNEATDEAVSLTNKVNESNEAILGKLSELEKFDLFKKLALSYGGLPFDVLISISNYHLNRLSMDVEQARIDLMERYNKKSRSLLTDSELIDYLDYLAKI